MCRTVMTRRSTLYKDEYMDSLGKLVTNLCDKFKQIHHCTGIIIIIIIRFTVNAMNGF